ncbi:ABC transporter ATP-binding protein [Oscillibacter sp. MSJ-2]|uniref:ABC transporter ATP-binding protein n=1 Tax=Dysosmobacter acutus TaxID=2841504 RepID=A0ABS6FC85_9FIRM|nr:ABC transporter ATP-binding protein [Dysosmobacter acutus]MBU5627887.1 ABC transporter ATP-binding protein [Dysosmobacter acutus]
MEKNGSFEIKDLKISYKVFNGELQVVDGMNLRLNSGERMGLVGEAGCGKTTTLKSVLGILPSNAVISSGEVLFNGEDVLKFDNKKMQEFRKKNCAMIFQDPSSALNPIFKVKDLMMNGMRNSLAKSKDWKKVAYEKAVSSLRDVMLPDPERIMENYPFQLSGGMRQRVCIAMAIATDRHLLLADEPTTSLDVTIQEQILKLIYKLSIEKKLSVILVTHSMGVIREMTDRVSVMYAGTVMEVGDTKDVLESPQHPYTKALIACIPKLTGSGVAEGIPGRVPDYLNPPKGCRYVDRCPYATAICREEKPKLTDCGKNHQIACHNCGR